MYLHGEKCIAGENDYVSEEEPSQRGISRSLASFASLEMEVTRERSADGPTGDSSWKTSRTSLLYRVHINPSPTVSDRIIFVRTLIRYLLLSHSRHKYLMHVVHLTAD